MLRPHCALQCPLVLKPVTQEGGSPVTRFEFALDCLRTISTCFEAGTSIQVDVVGRQSICQAHRTPQLQNYTAAPTDIVGRFSGGDGNVHTVACRDSKGTSRNPTYHLTRAGSITFVGLQEGRHILRVYAIDDAGNRGQWLAPGLGSCPLCFVWC